MIDWQDEGWIEFLRRHDLFPGGEPGPPQMLEMILVTVRRMETTLTATTDALAKLQADVAALDSQEKATLAYLQGLPALIRSAVADAVNTSGGNAQVVADQINQLAGTIEQDTAGLAGGVQAAPAEVVITVTPTSITGQAGVALAGQFVGVGGTSPYTFTADPPTDILVATDGTISGTPAAAESGTINVTATDANGAVGVTAVSYSIADAPAPVAEPAATA